MKTFTNGIRKVYDRHDSLSIPCFLKQNLKTKINIKAKGKLQNESTEAKKNCDFYNSYLYINGEEIHKSLANKYILLQYAIQALLVYLDFK